ncbi:MAG TPA: DJ-1/PfpI family protein [bacterium (Candidatus Stahlbacteria)]|nr:DJ-1/PfpI family protein [Candidatus Stahlbacteria bacterium]
MKRFIFILSVLFLLGQIAGKRRILMVIAHEGFRDEELLIPKETFTKAGYQVDVASTDTGYAVGMLGAKVKPDLLISEAAESLYVALVLVGGVGAKDLFTDTILHKLVCSFHDRGKLTGAICLAPIILARAGILKGKRATVWAGAKKDLIRFGASYVDTDVTIDSSIVTGSGPNAAEQFSLKILDLLK